MIKRLKKEKGITLIALVVTIIILLILAGVVLQTVTGDNGLISKAKQAVSKYKESESKEQYSLQNVVQIVDKENKESKISYINNIMEVLYGALNKLLTLEENYREVQDQLNRINEIIVQVLNTNPNESEILELQNEVNDLKNNIIQTVQNNQNIRILKLESEGFEDLLLEVKGFDILEGDLDIASEENNHKIEEVIENVSNMCSMTGSYQNRLGYSLTYYENYRDIISNETQIEKINKRLSDYSLRLVKDCVLNVNQCCNIYFNVTSTNKDKNYIAIEIQQLYMEMNRILTNAKNTEGLKLLNGDWDSNINITLSSLGISDCIQKLKAEDESVRNDFTNAISIIDAKLTEINK